MFKNQTVKVTYLLIKQQIKKAYYMPAAFAGRHVVGLGVLSIDISLEVQNQRYS